MDKLIVNLSEYIRNAYYSMPVFTNADDRVVSGAYGALFKIINSARNENAEIIEIVLPADMSDNSNTNNNALADQTVLLTDSIREAIGEAAADTGSGFSFSVNDNVLNALSDKLAALSPTGQVKAAPSFNLSMRSTSDLGEVDELFRKASGYGPGDKNNYVAFYLLTDTVNKDDTKYKEILGMSVCFNENEAVYIPVENFITADYLGKKLSELSNSVSLVTFDIKESYRVFTPFEVSDRDYGYSCKGEHTEDYKSKPRCFDDLIAAYLVNPNKNDYEVSDVAKEYLGLTLEKKTDLFGKKSIREADDKSVVQYACKCAFVCFKAEPLICKKLEKLQMLDLFYNIEMPLSYVLYSMEKEGIIARRDELKAYGDKLQIRISELEKSIYEAAGVEFNINSPKQLGEILFERLGLPAEKKTKSGYSTAADVLEKLAPDYPIVADILEYRGLAKLKSTYADGLAAYIEEDGRIHTSFNQTITATGRISSTEPNLQNIPMRTELGRLIRKVFVPKEDHVFADADYSQIELRILAHMSEDQELIAAYHEGKDIHGITASKVFHVPFEEVTPLQRRNAKAVNFGIVYGISSFGLSQDLSISVKEAKEYMDKYFETYPGVKAYQERVIADAKEKGYSLTMFGRRRPIPELKASNYMMRQFGERVAMNAPIQGTAADIMKIAMINVYFRLKKEKLVSKLILQIHDELVIETLKDEEEKVTALLTQEMERAADLSVPLLAECHTGTDWYEAK
ncbi:DNA polymerase I [Butyrivibrio proteoclasticus]|uniref:DNA polymerase I n=1 Tax=Butyrivibrio proteoclasticus TaxID=43305 RepID=UPI00047A469B|nr:DNA polymerase I [Butyrivibrio proteoclasticus]